VTRSRAPEGAFFSPSGGRAGKIREREIACKCRKKGFADSPVDSCIRTGLLFLASCPSLSRSSGSARVRVHGNYHTGLTACTARTHARVARASRPGHPVRLPPPPRRPPPTAHRPPPAPSLPPSGGRDRDSRVARRLDSRKVFGAGVVRENRSPRNSGNSVIRQGGRAIGDRRSRALGIFGEESAERRAVRV